MNARPSAALAGTAAQADFVATRLRDVFGCKSSTCNHDAIGEDAFVVFSD